MIIIIGTRSKHIKYMVIADETSPFKVECGRSLNYVEIAYETFGQMNKNRSNVILIEHAFSGDSHVGTHADEEEIPGWWHDFIGPNKIFDTNKYCILCSNVLGGCMGSTGPSSIMPGTEESYNLIFPMITIRDMVHAQKRLVDKLGINKILAVVGGSMGGMQVLEWAISYPNMIKAAIPIATTPRLSPQGIAFNEVGRRAIINDPKWKGGDYKKDDPPNQGLALARMIAHITYLSDDSMREKFGRVLHCDMDYKYQFCPEFEVESYLNHQGYKFTNRFDANTYLYLSKAIDYFDLERSYGSLVEAFNNVESKFLIISFESDWLYPIYQGKEMVSALQQAGKDVTYCEISSHYGHDAFLLEYDNMSPILIPFLNKLLKMD